MILIRAEPSRAWTGPVQPVHLDIYSHTSLSGTRFLPAFNANDTATGRGSGEDVATTTAAKPTHRTRPPAFLRLSRTVLPTLAALQLMQRANRKALQQTCRAPGGVNGRRPRGRPAVMLMRAPKARGTDRPREGTRRRQPRRRRTAKLRPTHLLERKRRGAASSSIRVGTWKLNCRLPGRGGNGDEIKCRQACSEMASVAYCGRLGAGQLVAVCLLVSTHSFKGPTDSCRSTTFQEPPAPGVRWWLPLVLQQQQLGDASILLTDTVST